MNNTHSNPATQFDLGAAAAKLYLADDDRYVAMVRQPVNTQRELDAFGAGWRSVTQPDSTL